jgi:hypothetical protein
MTCVILQDDSESAEDQPCTAEHTSGLGEDLSGCKSECTEDPFGSPEVPPRRRTRKSHYVAPPLVPTNPESQLIIKQIQSHICHATHRRTLRLRAHAIKGRLMVSWVTSCVCTIVVRSLREMAPALLPPVGLITLLLPM